MLAVTNLFSQRFTRFADRLPTRTSGRAVTGAAILCCVLGLAGAGFDYSIANAAAFSDDGVVDATNLLAWGSLLRNVLAGSLGIILAAATVLALGLWTAPQATIKVIPPQRHIYGEAD